VPTYEYECDACHRTFEVRQRISEPALTTCEACGGSVRRLLSPAPFILKGGGWYVTDYPSESRKKAMDAEKSSSSSSSSDKSDKGSDKGDKGDKGDKADKPAASAPKTDGNSSSGTSASSSGAAPSKPSD
jgi:putative FmdB family regulatory protein